MYESISRVKAFADAGADCLYVPGIKSEEHIAAIVQAASGRAVNFLNPTPLGYTVDDLAHMGIRRISVGGSLARVAMDAFLRAAQGIAQEGSFEGFADEIGRASCRERVGQYV